MAEGASGGETQRLPRRACGWPEPPSEAGPPPTQHIGAACPRPAGVVWNETGGGGARHLEVTQPRLGRFGEEGSEQAPGDGTSLFLPWSPLPGLSPQQT